MKSKIIFLISMVLFARATLFAQSESGLDLRQKKKIIFFLMRFHQIDEDTLQWRNYLDAIECKELFINRRANNLLYAFSSTSPHALVFFFLKEGQKEILLDWKYSNASIKVLMDFFSLNSGMNAKIILKSISEVIDIYQTNVAAGSKIPISSN